MIDSSWRVGRRAICLTFGLIVGVFSMVTAGHAETWPDKPIHLIVPFPPGGVADLIARPVAQKLSVALGVPVVVENRGGATGTIGAAYVAHSKPDGYTLLLGTTNEIAMSPALYKTLPYDPTTAFAAITPFVVFPNVLVVSASSPIHSVDDLIAAARAKPGTQSYASSGTGSTNHLTAELFSRAAKLKILNVPYKGGGPALVDVVGGQDSAMFATLPSAITLIQGGKLRALMVTGDHRSNALPDVPTGREAGVPQVVVTTWNGVLAPAGTPAAVVSRLYAVLKQASDDDELRKRFAAVGAEIALQSPQAFQQTMGADFHRWSTLIRTAGITAQ